MFASLDKRWIISTPAKNASTRLHHALKRTEGWKRFPPLHGGARHADRFVGYEDYLILYRDPLERAVSQFWFSKSIKNGGDFTTFDEFQVFMARGVSKALMWRCQRDYAIAWRPSVPVYLPNVEPMFNVLGKDVEYWYGRVSRHANRTRATVDETLKGVTWHPEFRDWLLREYEALEHYPVPEVLK